MGRLLEGLIGGFGRPFFSLEGCSARARVNVIQVLNWPVDTQLRPTFFMSSRPMNKVGLPVALTGNQL
jgi:hypothetical protein